MTGLSEVIGSWKTMAIASPRICAQRVVAQVSRSVPLKTDLPPTIRPGGDWIRRRIDSTPTVLPLPLSPTIARHSPLSTE